MSLRHRLHDWCDARQGPDYLERLRQVYAVEHPIVETQMNKRRRYQAKRRRAFLRSIVELRREVQALAMRVRARARSRVGA